MNLDDDVRFMQEALKLARQALEADEVPVGAVVVKDGRIIGKGYNQRQTLKDPTAHAEMLAITAAAEALGDWRLEGTSLYVTLEPCIMCAGAILLSRIERLVYAADDPKGGAVKSLYSLLSDKRLNHTVEVKSGILQDEAAALLRGFFKSKRM